MRINYRELAGMYRDPEIGPRRTCSLLRESLERKQVRPEDFSLREAAEDLLFDRQGDCCGREFVRSLDPRQDGLNLLEAGSAVDSSAFSNITGQIVFSTVIEAFDDPMFIGDQLCTVVPSKLEWEKIPGVDRIGDDSATVDEGQPYTTVGVGQRYIETPRTTKRGMICPVTKEAIFFDRTGQVVERCREVGYWLGFNREMRILYEALGNTTYASGYKENGTSYDTYQASTPWINTASNTLTDWTDINNAEDKFWKMTDPSHGEYIQVSPDTVIVPTKLKGTAAIILGAAGVQIGGATNAAHYYTQGGNPISGYKLVSGPNVYKATSSDATWYLGNPKKAFMYMENWPITVTQMGENSQASFERDIVLQFKASERGVTAVKQPRYMVQNT